MRKLVAIGFFFIIVSCGSNEDELKNETIIPQEKMKEILVDFHINEAYLSNYPGAVDTLNKNVLVAYENSFKKFGISKEDFKLSVEYYTRHPETLKAIMESVVDSLSTLEATLNSNAVPN